MRGALISKKSEQPSPSLSLSAGGRGLRATSDTAVPLRPRHREHAGVYDPVVCEGCAVC